VRINARADQQYIPQAALDVPLRPAVLPINRPDNKIDCANLGCVTRTGQRTQGNRNCIAYLCGSCCKDARTGAIESNTARPKCNSHKQPAATPTILGHQPVVAHHPAPMNNLVAQLPPRANSQMPIQLYHPPQNPAAQNHAIDPALREEHSESNPRAANQGRQKSLAQPMGQNWAQKRQYALEEDSVQKSLKMLRQENDEKKKRTCDICIWFQVSLSCNALQSMLTHLVG
jgi:hypothetical protein